MKTLLFILSLLLFVSCASISPVGERLSTTVSAIPETVQPDWRSFAREISGGLDYFEGKISSPRLEFFTLRVDLFDPGLQIITVGGASNENNAVENANFLSVKVSTFVRVNQLLAGVNALPFDVVSGREGEPRKNIGVVISNGVTVSPPHPTFDALVFYSDGKTAIIPQSEIAETDGAANIKNAVGGFFRILENGEPVPRVLNSTARHPRSAAGICPNGKYLFILVIDGRRPGSIGATEKETALLLRALGAAEGINFDGGGSSALALRYPDGRIRTTNKPIHKLIPGRERAVAGCLGVGVKNNEQ